MLSDLWLIWIDVQRLAKSAERQIPLKAPLIAAKTRQAVRNNNHMADFAGIVARTSVRTSAQDEPSAKPGSKMQHGQIVVALARPVKPFTDRGCGRIIFKADRKASLALQIGYCVCCANLGQAGGIKGIAPARAKRTGCRDAKAKQPTGCVWILLACITSL